jgi:hypothetical protein
VKNFCLQQNVYKSSLTISINDKKKFSCENSTPFCGLQCVAIINMKLPHNKAASKTTRAKNCVHKSEIKRKWGEKLSEENKLITIFFHRSTHATFPPPNIATQRTSNLWGIKNLIYRTPHMLPSCCRSFYRIKKGDISLYNEIISKLMLTSHPQIQMLLLPHSPGQQQS